jgi:cysteine desulfurase
VLEACAQLAREGFEVEHLPPAADGRVTPESVAAALRAETLLVSLMLVNNETGVVQDLRAISAVCRPRGVLVHTDAAQALGRIPLDVVALDVDLLSVSAHKCGGPVGIGALYVRRLPRPTLDPLLFGGGQEGGLRPGTQAVALASAFAAAATEAVEQQSRAMAAQREWAERLLAGLAGLPGWQQNGRAAPRVPTILSLTFDGVDGEALLLAMEPFAVASGAACSSAAREPSGVLRALGLDDARAESTLRISFGWTTTTAAVDGLARHLARVVSRLRALASAEAVGDAAGRVALADGLTEAAAPAGPYSRRLRQWVAAPLRAWVDSPLQGGAAECFEGSATDPASRTVVGFRAGADGQGGWRVRWTARGCPHVLGACEVMAETLERELVFRRRVCSTGTGGESGPPVTVPSMDLRSFAAAVDAPPDKLTRLLAVQEAAAALRRRYTAV